MLRLRPYRTTDTDRIISWAQNEDIFYKWSAGVLGSFPITKERFEKLQGAIDNDKFFPFVMTDNDIPVGYLIMRIPGEDRNVLRFGFVIVDPEIRCKGYGKKMLELSLNYAFNIYNANEVTLGVFEDNDAAYKCYKSVGFMETGDTEEYELNGKIWKCVELKIENK